MKVLNAMAEYNHEEIVFCQDRDSGLRAIIAIHDTTLGPALGGTRMWPYKSEEEALEDVRRLSRGMTYKSAAAGLNLGGGKAVIIGDPQRAKNEMLFRAFGRFVHGLNGRYITAEDVGTEVRDMEFVRMETPWVVGISEALGGSGDPSPVTARGVFYCVEALLGGDVAGKRVAVQGVGHVGLHLCKLLKERGAALVVSDVNADNLERARALGAEVGAVDAIHKLEVDLFSPCALGAGLNEKTIPELGAPIICGAANNQLATEADGARLLARGITYAPDYVVNAGGIINVSAEYLGESADVVEGRIRAIAPRLMRVLETARAQGAPPHEAADRMVRERLAAAKRARS
jgi:leucine dehydrogenase